MSEKYLAAALTTSKPNLMHRLLKNNINGTDMLGDILH